MAETKVVKGTLTSGAKVSTSEANAQRLGASFTPEGKTPAKSSAKADDAKK